MKKKIKKIEDQQIRNIEILDIDNKITMPANVWEECMRIGEKELGIVFNEDTKRAPVLDKVIPIKDAPDIDTEDEDFIPF